MIFIDLTIGYLLIKNRIKVTKKGVKSNYTAHFGAEV